jgi:quercetin dioxygenase-like cupin family protein
MNGETVTKSGKTAQTLARDDRMTVVITVMKEGAELETHKTDSPIAVNVVAGSIVFTVGAERKQVAVTAGGAIVMSSGVPHSARALSDSSFLLVIGGREA